MKERYEGQVGLARLKAHMQVAYAERQQGAGSGWGADYFRGWLRGLASADAIGADIALAAHEFVSAGGYERAYMPAAPGGSRGEAERAVEAATSRRDSIRRKLDAGSDLVSVEELAQAEEALTCANAALTALHAGA